MVASTAGAQVRRVPPPQPIAVQTSSLFTRAERSNYLETSTYADVIAFLDTLQVYGARVFVGEMGRTSEGRSLPYVIASRPLVTSPAEARRLGRPVVYVQANIHAGEVEGKEALLALLRDLSRSPRVNVLDSIVLIAIPIYNADGNERFAPQAQNRGAQNGPEMVGQRPNAQGLDLNRDYIKAEAPETRASLAMFAKWDPDVFVDLHTTDGSYHGYALTYSPSLHPAAAIPGATSGGAYAADTLLPLIRKRVRDRARYETFDYGNFVNDEESPPQGQRRDPRIALTDINKRGWITYDHRPRFGTNYYGLRGRISILSEAYSHDPFERRVRSTYAFVNELLSAVAERGPHIVQMSRASDAALADWPAPSMSSRRAPQIPLRAKFARSVAGPVIVEKLERTADSTLRTQPGVPVGIRRTGQFMTMRMPITTRFEATVSRTPPAAWWISAGDTALVRRLREHGVVVERLNATISRADAESFIMDSISRAARPFQGHNEITISGRWTEAPLAVPEGSYIIPAAQSLGVLAAILLEPESDDSFATWNVLDPSLRVGEAYPVRRLLQPVRTPRRMVP